MNDGDKRADELSDLAHRIDLFDRAHSQVRQSKPPRDRPLRPPISPIERKARRWFLGIVSAWGAFIYALILVQGWGSASVWELIFAGPFVAFCVFGIYGFHLFYVELGKSVLRMFRGKKTGD
jgi:hypothetical protein